MPVLPVDDQADAPIDQSRLLDQIGYQLTHVELDIHHRLVRHLSAFKLRPVEYSLLVLVDANPGINQRGIGEVLGVSPSNLVAVITRLTRRHLIRRSRGRDDRRIQHLHLTAAGGALLADADAVVRQFNTDLVAPLTQQETRLLARALGKMRGA